MKVMFVGKVEMLEEVGDGEKISPPPDPTPPAPPLWRIGGPVIVKDLQDRTLPKPRRAF
ncbi:hypothetical protein P0O24_12435 [Methanotrichaceae archaeon M04Ac]|uniref:Uncharacterized protein n=1 Tax=Candidatus Methanocrinis alkalitolerans TaxID=3033395 RepID=A0ABT5XIB9_9EURY|nr:hypothetical protein [Candidatus Methanocrinis alkalitolerans]MDF0594381.1 hypothetical protein [Candidatus Methanocrinis alkalitolerans]